MDTEKQFRKVSGVPQNIKTLINIDYYQKKKKTTKNSTEIPEEKIPVILRHACSHFTVIEKTYSQTTFK